MNYANVRLENTGPFHLPIDEDSLEIDPVTLRGADTNLQIAGSVQFAGRRAVDAPKWRFGPEAHQRFCAEPRRTRPAQINAPSKGRSTGRASRPRATSKTLPPALRISPRVSARSRVTGNSMRRACCFENMKCGIRGACLIFKMQRAPGGGRIHLSRTTGRRIETTSP